MSAYPKTPDEITLEIFARRIVAWWEGDKTWDINLLCGALRALLKTRSERNRAPAGETVNDWHVAGHPVEVPLPFPIFCPFCSFTLRQYETFAPQPDRGQP